MKWRNLFEDHILDRGFEYYESGLVKDFCAENDFVRATVEGGSDYNVFIDIEKEEILTMDCDCPYAAKGQACKHMAAVLFYWENDEDEVFGLNANAASLGVAQQEKKAFEKTEKNEDKNSLSQVIKKISLPELQTFVLQYAKEQDKFARDILLMFGEPQVEEEMARIEAQVDEVICANRYSGFIDEQGCDCICDEFMEILKLSDKYAAKEHFLLSFEISLYILLTSLKLTSATDSSSGLLTMVIDDSLENIEKVCSAVVSTGEPHLQEQLYKLLCKAVKNKVFDGWDESHYELLRIAVYFVTEKNKEKMYDALKYLYALYERKGWAASYVTEDKLIKLSMIRKLEGKDAADRFVKANLSIEAFREIAVKTAVADGMYVYAEELCLNMLETKEEYRHPFGKPSKWYYYLYELYERSGRREKQIEIAEKILLLNDLEFYGVLKQLLQEEGKWQAAYPVLLRKCEEGLDAYSYMHILFREKEWAALLSKVKAHPEVVFKYGDILAESYPNEIFSIYEQAIIQEAASAKTRPQYREMCSSISKLYKAGGKIKANELILRFLEIYKRRVAMGDELRQLAKKLSIMI